MMAKQLSDTKKEFVQKYMLDEYSRAIPTSALSADPDKVVLLGEYSEPKDSVSSRHVYRNTRDVEVTSDSEEDGYACPQDAVKGKRPPSRNPSKESDTDVYELAQQTIEDYDITGAAMSYNERKPSPKPRRSQANLARRTSHDVTSPIMNDSAQMIPQNNTQSDGNELSRASQISQTSQTSMPSDPNFEPGAGGRRRPMKKVVEIEYEVASAIRPGKIEYTNSSPSPGKRLTKSNSTADSGISVSPPSVPHNAQHAPPSSSVPNNPKSSPPHHVRDARPSPQMGISSPSAQHPAASGGAEGAEGLYEEPWDLKVKRLKQEEEEKRKSRQAAEQQVLPDTSQPVYEVAWDCASSQKKLEEKLTFARSLSVTSEKDIFHDAEDSALSTNKTDGNSIPQPPTSEPPGKLKPLPTDTYEDAWDLKNTLLEQKLREMHVQSQPPTTPMTPMASASSTYEEPWDRGRQQDQLQGKFLKSPNTPKSPEQRSQRSHSDAHAHTHSVQNVQASVYEEPWDRGKQQEQMQARFRKTGSLPAHTSPPSHSHTHSHHSPHSPHTHSHHSPHSPHSHSSHREHRGERMSHRTSLDHTDSHKPTLSKMHSVDDSKSKSKSRGCNIGQRINPMIPLANQNWFHGNISRDDSEKMLCVCKEGSYIVRISSDRKSYSLSIKSSKQYIHVQIEELHLLDGTVRYILGKNSKEFPSIPEMIDYYTHHRVPLKGAEHITLLHPVECKWS